MADGGSSNSSWESWFGEWVQTAKEKSNTALEFVKKDLAEFTCTVQKETEKAVEKTSSSLTKANTEQATNKFKAGISSFFDNISKALVIPPDDDYVPMKVSADGTSLYDRGTARLHALQLDASTYVDPPRGTPEQFNMWLECFDMEQHKGDISELLVSKVEVRALYTKLVPNEVSHADFWQRYFYRVHQLQCDEARKQALMQRADQARGDSLSWDDDWSGGEEEDDGNQSDWEKMPRPSQSALVEKPELIPLEPSNKSPLNTPTEESSKALPELRDSGNQDTLDKSQPLAQVQADRSESFMSSNQYVANALDAVSPSSSDQSKPLSSIERGPSVTVDRDQVVSGSHPSQPPPELWNLQTPSDTSSASHPVIGEEGERVGVGEASMQLAPDRAESNRLDGNIRQKEDSFSGAAAASVELPSSNRVVENLTAEGACGAADMVDSSSQRLPISVPSNLDIPAASSSSSSSSLLLEPTNSVEDKKSETERTDAVVQESASSHSKKISQDDLEVEDQRKVPPPTSLQSDLTVETSNPNDAGDEMSPEIKMRVKGDMVVVGERGSPSTESSDTKDLALDEDWEDFDVEVTEEDLKAAEDIAKKLGENLDAEDDDWENWE